MIGSETRRRRGGPLTMLGILVFAWIGGRVMLWESPFAANLPYLPESAALLADFDIEDTSRRITGEGARLLAERLAQADDLNGAPAAQLVGNFGLGNSHPLPLISSAAVDNANRNSPYSVNPQVAAGHQLLWAAALAHIPMPRAVESVWQAENRQRRPLATVAFDKDSAPFLAQPASSKGQQHDRWSLDTWSFWRQGSNASAISQGRVPIYGASQIGASARYRLAPASGNDPLLYGRAYRALVSNGETEFAAGFAARPVAKLPVRAFAELRYTDNAFGSELRPAVFAVTELQPMSLPVGLTAEAYGQAGYVGGDDPTPFADGQVIVSREVVSFDLSAVSPARVSVGAGVWGGAQEDAARLDLGPTVRLDLTIGKVPARVSVDWREQVAGDAAPGSGIAATLSTRF